jgi:amino acid adenylation domain-containing protein
MNTVVVRGDLSGNPSFRQLLSSTRARLHSAIEHEDYPFSLLVQRLGTKREPGRTPVFQAMFQLHKSMESDLAALLVPSHEVRSIDFGGLAVEAFPFAAQEGQVDLTLEIVESAVSLAGSLKFRVDRFERATIERMSRHFETLLESVVASPDEQIGGLAILPADERQTILNEWNATETAYASELGVHALVEAITSRMPGRTAVTQGNRSVTYAELNDRANGLAQRLRRSGVGPGALVGIGLNRTPDMIAALLAVLKAGGAYLPLDPDFPAQRIGWMLEDASPRLLVTERALENRWPASAGIPLLCIDDLSESLDNEPAGNLPDIGTGDSLAYTIFTSGSTGRPKGIQIPRRAVVNLLGALQEQLALTPDDRLLAVTTLSFDIAVAELLLPLSVGATVVLATREDASDPSRLAALMPGVTVMQATPATWRMLCDSGWLGTSSLKALCGGETLPSDLATRLLERAGEVWNLYGPTETTVWSTAERLTRGDAITIGRPIANTHIYVVDTGHQLVPVGVAGEVWIGGEGVARGYHGRADLTAERFLDDPFRPGGRIYRTGDVGRWLPDGRLEHLGRLDQQVKVRGFRIELPEIEAALLDMPSIREAAVLAETVPDGDRRLVAFIVPQDETVSTDSVRTGLRVRLPDYMVPARLVRVEALPLTPNGKVDRRALAAMSSDSELSCQEFVAPGSPMEQLLAGVWSEVLGVPRIGIHDNFFDLGGHSLLITQLASRLSIRHGIDMPMSLLFDAPTVAQLAAAVDESCSGAPCRDEFDDQRLSA